MQLKRKIFNTSFENIFQVSRCRMDLFFFNSTTCGSYIVLTHGERQVVNKAFPDPGFKKKSIYSTNFKNFRQNDKLHRHNSYYSTLYTYEP
jgi:hypothetical protein